jgi:hypothetical protein
MRSSHLALRLNKVGLFTSSQEKKKEAEERDRIVLDNKMCYFCLLHRENDVC